MQPPGGFNYSGGRKCLLRWEITSKCNANCKLCFTSNDRSRSDLSYEDCLKILSSFRQFVLQNNLNGNIIFGGCSSLSREDFWDILDEGKKHQQSGAIKSIALQTSPYYINEETVQRLKYYGNIPCSLELYGIGSTHDSFREPGDFQQTITALRSLQKTGHSASIKFTPCRSNIHEIVDVFKLAISENVKLVLSKMLIPIGKGEAFFKNEHLAASEYRNVLVEILDFLDELPVLYNNFKHSVLLVEHLFVRLFYETGRLNEYIKMSNMFGGNQVGCAKGLAFAVLSDGTVQARRHIPTYEGTVPKDSFQKVYDSSKLIKSLESNIYSNKKKEESEKCRNCPVVDYCGSCLGHTYIVTGCAYGPDPMCWVE